jgi:hypothetical protein
MAEIPDLNRLSVSERVFNLASKAFYGPEMGQGGETRSPEGELVPPAGYDPAQSGLTDPFLASWDPARGQRIVNPTYEQRTIGLSEAIAKGVGEARGTLPVYLASKQVGMAKQAIGSLIRGAKSAQRRFR